jgi:hypothetical protein
LRARFVETLDYKPPEVRRRSVWPRRYKVFVPIVSVCYWVLAVSFFFYVMTYAGARTVPEWLTVAAYIIGCPLFYFIGDNVHITYPGLLVAGNGVIWGFFVVGFFHAMALIRTKLSGGS